MVRRCLTPGKNVWMNGKLLLDSTLIILNENENEFENSIQRKWGLAKLSMRYIYLYIFQWIDNLKRAKQNNGNVNKHTDNCCDDIIIRMNERTNGWEAAQPH